MALKKMTIAELAKGMFEPNGMHMKRLELLGKHFCSKSIQQKHHYLDLIVKEFGSFDLCKLPETKIISYLFEEKTNMSSSWKNRYLEVFKQLYDEYMWRTGLKISKPSFPRFANSSRKADVFSTSELNSFFKRNLWNDDGEFLMFYVLANCGLRLGEARALKVQQFDFDKNIVIIDGFIRYDGSRTTFNKCGNKMNSKIRVVLLSKKCSALIKSYIRTQDLKKGDYLFTRNKIPFRHEFSEHLFKRQLLKSGIKINGRKLTPHSLRYTYVTRMRRFVDAETVRKLVGHSSQMMTDYYTRPLVDDMCVGIMSAHNACEQLFN